MSSSVNPIFLIPTIVVSIAAIGDLLLRFVLGTTGPRRVGIIFCVVPSVLLLILFYSLAWHMHQVLGGWPISIGERGFPSGLLIHANIACNFFAAMLLATLFVWPFVFLVCRLVRPWRQWTIYLSLYAVAFAVCTALMQLAPAPFLYWWRD